MKNKLILIGGILLIGIIGVSPLSYADSPYRGKVIDAETKEPIEGAVVVVVWTRDKRTLGGGIAFFEEAQETLTDRNGEFTIPGFIRLPSLNPFIWRNEPSFFIWKPGYGFFPRYQISPPPLPTGKTSAHQKSTPFEEITHADFFSRELGSHGKVITNWEEEKGKWTYEEVPVLFGVVELPRLKDKEKRRNILHGIPPFSIRLTKEEDISFAVPIEKIPNFIRLLNLEDVYLGFEPSFIK